MFPPRYAKLAVMPVLFLLTAIGPLQESLKVKFQLADGVRITGELSTWDRDGFDGTFGRRQWIELNTDDLWKLHQRLMDQNVADQWVDLGRVLLQVVHRDAHAETFAERAFARALRIDPQARQRIEQVRNEIKRLDRQRKEDQQKAEQAKLKTLLPEAEPWPPDPWPALSDAEHDAAVLVMRADAQARMESMGLALAPVETDHFLVYSDLPRADVARWAVQLEKACAAFRTVMMPTELHQPPANTAPRWFWGKAVVFVFKEQDRFRLMEVESFRQLVPESLIAICHPIGAKIFIAAHRVDDDELFQWMLTHAAMQGVLHGYRSPKRLPAWANDGLAEYITSLVLRDLTIAASRRRAGIDFIRGAGDARKLVSSTYADQTWPGPNQIGLPVGSLLVELLITQQQLKFIDWVNSVKQGIDWQDALRSKLGASSESLAETLVQYYRVND